MDTVGIFSDSLEGLIGNDVFDAAGILFGDLRIDVQRDQALRQHFVSFVDPRRDGSAFFQKEDMTVIGKLIWDAATDFENKADSIRAQVASICAKYPIYE